VNKMESSSFVYFQVCGARYGLLGFPKPDTHCFCRPALSALLLMYVALPVLVMYVALPVLVTFTM
jgi:hypothetical protein